MLNKEKLHLFSFEMQKGVKPSDARLKYLRSHEILLHPNHKCHIIPLNSIFDEPKKSVLLPYLYTDILCKKYNNSIKEDLYGMKKKDKISKIEEKKSKIEEKISKIEEKLEEKLEEKISKIEEKISKIEEKLIKIEEKLEGKLIKIEEKLEGKLEEKISKIEEKISKIEEKLIKIEEKLEERNSYNRELEQYLYFI